MSTTNPYWQQATWVIDPANSTGLASDGNTGLDATHPLLTWGEVQARWGTDKPRIAQNTTVTFLSSQTLASDAIYCSPYLINATFVIQGQLGASQQIATGVLSSVTAKNRATPQLLFANSGATAINQLVVNTTHASRAWTSISEGGGVFAMSQPIAPVTVPSAVVTVTEVDTWANGDSVTVYAPTQIIVGEVRPKIVDFTASFSNAALFFYQIEVALTPGGVGEGSSYFNPAVAFVDAFCNNPCQVSDAGIQGLTLAHCNAIFSEYMGGPIEGVQPMLAGRIDFGRIRGCTFGADIIMGIGAGSSGLQISGIPSNETAMGACYVAASILKSVASVRGDLSTAGSTIVLWGTGAFDMLGRGRCSYPSGAGQAVAAFLLNGGLLCNNVQTNFSVTSAGTWASLSLTPAALDAAAGAAGFGGRAISPDGASFSNVGT